MKIFIANWKMQLSPEESVRTARRFARVFRDYKGRALLCPDFLSLAAVSKILAKSNLSLGSQDLSAFDRGAYTGEISPLDLRSLGVEYSLIGHSERRSYLQESDKLLAAKIKMALSHKIIPVLCVGENALERKQGRAMTVIKNQLKGALQSFSIADLRSLIIAYEPVWSIGTGLSCDRDKALRVKATINEWCRRGGFKKVPVLYGGSVKPDNALSFLGSDGFDGLLVGGAGLDPESFRKIADLN